MVYIGSINEDKKLLNADNIVICGYGKAFSKLYNSIELIGIGKKVVCICDSDKSKYFEQDGLKVCAYNTAITKYSLADYICYNNYSKEIYEFLFKNGIRKIHIITSV